MTKNCVLLLAFCCAASGQYNQPFRPQIHFSPAINWTNDPNGLVYFDGEYHLFFQYNPFGDMWGHMSWGHAVSPDMVHWQQLPVALAEENGVMIFTGSAVVDEHNTSGFCTGGKACMVAVYTGHTPGKGKTPALQTQNVAYSNDRGRTWTKYPGNPVLNVNMADFRDPDVFWSGEAQTWVMAVSLPNEHKIRFYNSRNLKEWRQVSEFGPAGATGGQWECPNLFPLQVDGAPGKTRWVLKVGLNPGALQGGSGEQYFIGQFDGTRFVNDNPAPVTLWTDYGKDCYCALAFNNLPRGAKPAMIGWMSNWQYAGKVPTNPWRGQMTVPRELSLKTYPEGIRLVQQPAAALATLREKHLAEKHIAWKGEPSEMPTHTFEVDAAMPPEAGWKLTQAGGSYTLIGYDVARQEVFVDRTHSGGDGFSKDFPARTGAPLPHPAGALRWQIVVDRNSVEVFADGGRVAITNLIFPSPGPFRVETYLNGGKATPPSVDAWTLKSIW